MPERISYGPPQTEAEMAGLAALIAQTFAGSEQRYGQWLQRLGSSPLRVLRLGERIVAGLVTYDMGQFFGARRVANWGIGCVAVRAECRSAGVGRELMLALLGEMRKRGVPISALYPATQPVYRRLGWELAGARVAFEVDVGQLLRREPSSQLREVAGSDQELIQQLYLSQAPHIPGHLDRSPTIWERVMHPAEGGKLFGYIVEDAGRPLGYILYVQQRTDLMSMKFWLIVKDLVFQTGSSGRRLLALLSQHRSVVERARLWAGPDGPLPCLADEQVFQPVDRFDWMLRIVNVKQALEQRGWPAGVRATLSLRVIDDVLPDNAGCYVLDVADRACVVRQTAAAETTVDIRGLAPLYTGRLSPAELRQAGYLQGPDHQDPLLQAVFAGPHPWTPDFF